MNPILQSFFAALLSTVVLAQDCEVGSVGTLKVLGAFSVDPQSAQVASLPVEHDKYYATCFGQSEGETRYLACGFVPSLGTQSDLSKLSYVTLPASTPIFYMQSPRPGTDEAYFVRCHTAQGGGTGGSPSVAQKWCSCDLTSQVLEEYDLNIKIACDGKVRTIRLAHYEDSFQCTNHLNATQSCRGDSSAPTVNVCECRTASQVLETFNLVRRQIACGKPDQMVTLAQGLDGINCRRQLESNPNCR